MSRRRAKLRRRLWQRQERQPSGTLLAATLLVFFLAIVYFVAPPSLPSFFQRLIGLANAVLAMLVVVFAIREFGHRFNRLRLPMIGRLRTSQIAGVAVFLLVLAWWLSPWAPIEAG